MSAPCLTLRHTAGSAAQAVAARRQPAAALTAPQRAAALPRRARKAACAAAAAASHAPAAADRAALPSRRAFLNGALKVSVASASLLSSVDDFAEAAPLRRSLSSAALAADAVHSPRASAAGSLELSAAREFDHASMLPLPLKPFGGALSGGSAPASLASASNPAHQPLPAASADGVVSPARRMLVLNLALSACPLTSMAGEGLFSQLVDAAADHGMDRLAAALPCAALPLAALLWGQQVLSCLPQAQAQAQAQEPALVLA